MTFCDDCGSLLPAEPTVGECEQCGAALDRPDAVAPEADGGDTATTVSTELEALPTTGSGSVKKADSMEWLQNRERPTGAELRRATLEKPSDFTGSTFSTDVSTVRLTGDPRFVETVAGLFAWMADMEDSSRRVEINLKEAEDRETGERTGNYALYLSLAERG